MLYANVALYTFWEQTWIQDPRRGPYGSAEEYVVRKASPLTPIPQLKDGKVEAFPILPTRKERYARGEESTERLYSGSDACRTPPP